ncbi:protein-export membrane protein SecD [Candidatus Synechococcus spongiarum LMB bulk15N]|uniref:Protein translocase subunit SecD n=1 Tax=Candidatus Synechococcus spongiarum LMB bulk15N TaxID=1943583 RepID=A0A1T1D473_9SYNE|nr:protein-export membrane protein SecD [Candidatus Synechococcus spongiarum LMB bulk15N]
MVRQGWFPVVLAMILAAAVLLSNQSLRLGLDLRGGHQLSARVSSSDPEVVITAADLDGVKNVIQRRIDGLGLAQTRIHTVGSDRVVVQLPTAQPSREGDTEAEAVVDNTLQQVASQITEKAILQFGVLRPAEVDRYATLLQQRRNANIAVLRGQQQLEQLLRSRSDSEQISAVREELEVSQAAFDQLEQNIGQLFDLRPLTGDDLVQVVAGPNLESQGEYYELNLTFSSDGARAFADLTKEVAAAPDLRLAILLDGRSISEATVGSEFRENGITGGGARITGTFTLEQARELEVQLRGGSLPYDTEIVEQRSVGATLGSDNVRRSLRAALVGLALVSGLMVVIYRLPGLVAVAALAIYALFNLAVYALVPVVLTLPGIAGLVLSFGMAVDANVLIFERIREELRSGRKLYQAVETGFSRAFNSIFDGSVTTLIGCLALGYLGSGLVRGFAITLGIGVGLSLFTSLVCSKTLLKTGLFLYPTLRQIKYFQPVQ